MGWALAVVHFAAEESTAVTAEGLIGVGTWFMLMGRLVPRLTMLKTCLKREESLHLASLVALVLVMK